MTASKAMKLSSLFRSAKTSLPSSQDATLKQFVSSLDTSSPITPKQRRSVKSPKSRSPSKNSASKAVSDFSAGTLRPHSVISPDSPEVNVDQYLERFLEMSWFSTMSHNNISLSLHREEASRDRKQKWVFQSTQNHGFDRLVRMCAQKLGADATIQVFGKLGRETRVKEYNALIGLCIEKARITEDEQVSLQQIYKAYQLFRSMKEQGFRPEEETYGPFLIFLIDMGKVEEFRFFCGVIHVKNPNSLSRLAYYKMLFWIRVNNVDKLKELCDYIADAADGDIANFKENYLLALCESDRKGELLQLLEIIDITKFSSLDHLTNIFKALGRLLLESFGEKFILALKSCDIGAENISNFIYNYAISVPNLAVEDAISKFKHLHGELEVTPSAASYEKLIGHCCDLLQAHAALDIVDQMFEVGLELPIETFHLILHACEESCDYNLFEGAYSLINDLGKMNLMPTSSMFNAIMAGYFREKNIHSALMVLKQMENADVKPDSQTFSYLIGNCDHEEDIVKYYEELKHSGVQITKYIFMALTNAYVACGQFEKAKQVVFDKGIPVKSLNEIKSVLVSALASHGQISALIIYDEIKQAKCNLEPKAIICLIKNLQFKGQLSRLLQLLEELNDPDYWADVCFRVILYCVRYKHLSSTVDLLKQLKDKFYADEVATEVLFDEPVFSIIAETDPVDLQFGLNLLKAIKEELNICPSQKSLEFLLSACVSAKDLRSSLLIWKEYQTAGLAYNVLSFLRMYQALLASGDHKSATNMLNKIPKDDPHVRCVIEACQATYIKPTSSKEKEMEMVRK